MQKVGLAGRGTAGGLTNPQLRAILVLEDSSPIMVSELARRMHLHPSTIVGILDRLETRHLVERTRSATDRRVVMVTLTRQGKITSRKIRGGIPAHPMDGREGPPRP